MRTNYFPVVDSQEVQGARGYCLTELLRSAQILKTMKETENNRTVNSERVTKLSKRTLQSGDIESYCTLGSKANQSSRNSVRESPKMVKPNIQGKIRRKTA